MPACLLRRDPEQHGTWKQRAMMMQNRRERSTGTDSDVGKRHGSRRDSPPEAKLCSGRALPNLGASEELMGKSMETGLAMTPFFLLCAVFRRQVQTKLAEGGLAPGLCTFWSSFQIKAG